MNSVYRAALLLMVTAVTVSAQEPYEPGLSGYGFKVGLALGNQFGEEISSSYSLPGPSGGLFATYQVHPKFSIQPELLLQRKGAKHKFNDSTAEFNMWYVQLPVLLKLNNPSPKSFTPSLYAGPAVGMLVRSRGLYRDENDALFADTDSKDLFKSTEVSTIFGISFDLTKVKFLHGNGKLAFDFRFDLGLTKLPKDGANTKSGTFTAFLGYSFL